MAYVIHHPQRSYRRALPSAAARLGFAVALGLLLFALAAAAPAHADYMSAQLLSGTSDQQFTSAASPAVAAGGGYVAFQGTLGAITGIWRRNLQTGAVELVAGTQTGNGAALSAPDAAGPSISVDGRYVAFTTTADLDSANEPSADAGCPEVYVRDMDLSASDSAAYTLVAALNGTTTGITFGGSCGRSSQSFAVAGAQAAPAVALSDSGGDVKVAFTLLSSSDIEGTGTTTDPSQVVVRDVTAKTTTVISVTPAAQPTPGGGAYPSTTTLAGGAARPGVGISGTARPPTDSTAAISADGTTVAWLGTEVLSQVPSATDVLTDVADAFGGGNSSDPGGAEIEPLWRRYADGAGAVTKRLLASAGLEFADVNTEENIGPGVVVAGSQIPTFDPLALSANGNEAAVIADAPTRVAWTNYEELGSASGSLVPFPADAYLVRVDDDAASSPQVTPLTVDDDYEASSAQIASIYDIAISPDGSEVAFDAARTEFTPLALISPPATYDNVPDTYVASVASGTLQNATVTYDGSAPNGTGSLGAQALAFSADNRSLVLASGVSNLFYGDVYPGSSQVYLEPYDQGVSTLATTTISPLPTLAHVASSWRLSLSTRALANGSVKLSLALPGAGTLTLNATAPLHSRHTTRVAQARVRARGSATRTVSLTLARRYRRLAAGRHGLYAILTVRFTATGHAALTRTLGVTFHRRSVKHRKATR